MTRLETLIAEAESLLATARTKAASDPGNLLAKMTLASTQAQLDDLKRQFAREQAIRVAPHPGDAACGSAVELARA